MMGINATASTDRVRIRQAVTCGNFELVKILGNPEIVRAFDALGVEPAPSTSAELEACMRAETERWRKVIAVAGIRLE